VFLASRESLAEELKQWFLFHNVSMACPEVNSDLMGYTEEVVNGRLSNGGLVVGDEGIVVEIQMRLRKAHKECKCGKLVQNAFFFQSS